MPTNSWGWSSFTVGNPHWQFFGSFQNRLLTRWVWVSWPLSASFLSISTVRNFVSSTPFGSLIIAASAPTSLHELWWILGDTSLWLPVGSIRYITIHYDTLRRFCAWWIEFVPVCSPSIPGCGFQGFPDWSSLLARWPYPATLSLQSFLETLQAHI